MTVGAGAGWLPVREAEAEAEAEGGWLGSVGWGVSLVRAEASRVGEREGAWLGEAVAEGQEVAEGSGPSSERVPRALGLGVAVRHGEEGGLRVARGEGERDTEALPLAESRTVGLRLLVTEVVELLSGRAGAVPSALELGEAVRQEEVRGEGDRDTEVQLLLLGLKEGDSLAEGEEELPS